MNNQTSEQTKLFYIESVVNDYEYRKQHYNNVLFIWFITDKKTPDMPFDLAIKDYQPVIPGACEIDGYAESMILEMFNEHEANLFKEYIEGMQCQNIVSTKLLAVTLPIEKNMMPMGAIPVGGHCDFYMLSEHKDYNLPFKAWGYFDLREHTGATPIQKELS